MDLPSLSSTDRQARSLTGLAHQSLGKICDSGCDVTFTAENVTVYHMASPSSWMVNVIRTSDFGD
jgi:hypothetical protein